MHWLALVLTIGCAGGGRAPASPPDAAADAASPEDLGFPDPRARLDARPAPDASLSQPAFAAAYCDALHVCCTDQPRCRAAIEGMSPYREANAPACLALLRAAGLATLCNEGYEAAAQTCQRVFAGVVASKRLGQPCTQNDDCLLSPQGPVRCAGEPGMGRCQVLVRGKEGQGPCVGTKSDSLTVPAGGPMSNAIEGFVCDVHDNLWCDEATGKCTKASSGACASFGQCGGGYYCDDASGKCAERKFVGAACTVDEECVFTICGEDNKCAPPPAVAPSLYRCVTP